MQRVTISMDDDLFNQLDALLIQKGYTNRSEIFRDFIREQLRLKKLDSDEGYCTAVVSYSYSHRDGSLPGKIISQHSEHDAVVVSAMHIHATEEECVETVILHGKVVDVRRLGEATIAAKGIRNGAIHLIPLENGGRKDFL